MITPRPSPALRWSNIADGKRAYRRNGLRLLGTDRQAVRLNREGSSDPILHLIPVAVTEMAEGRQLRPVHRQHVYPEVRLGSKPGGLPILENAVGGGGRFGLLGSENADKDVRVFHQVCATGDHNSRANFCFDSAGQHANHDVAGLQ